MKEHPILFSGEMVRAILEGRKTQTRRVMKPQPVLGSLHSEGDTEERLHWIIDRGESRLAQARSSAWEAGDEPFWTWCPYGQPGDRLWVRETWKYEPDSGGPSWDELMQAREEPHLGWWPPNRGIYYRASETPYNQESMKPWRSPLHMFKELARICLTVTDVRVERLQEISLVDCAAEGIRPPESTVARLIGAAVKQAFNGEDKQAEIKQGVDRWFAEYEQGREAFSTAWDSLNAKRGHGWDTNPWVWVVSFEKAE